MLEQGIRRNQIREPSQDYQNYCYNDTVCTLIVEALIQLVLMVGTVGFQFIISIFHLLLANFQLYQWM